VVDKELVKKMTRLAKVLGFWPMKNKIKGMLGIYINILKRQCFVQSKFKLAPEYQHLFSFKSSKVVIIQSEMKTRPNQGKLFNWVLSHDPIYHLVF